MVKAMKAGDVATQLNCLATADRHQTLGWLAYQLEWRAYVEGDPKQDAALALLKKKGLYKKDIMGLMQVYDSPGGKGVAKAVELVGSEIKDQALFAKEAAGLLMPDQERNAAEMSEPSESKLLAVRIDGDVASAELAVPQRTERLTVYFRKEDGSWRITGTPPEDKARKDRTKR